MTNIGQLKPSTLDALKKMYANQRDTIEYMQKHGTALEKAIAVLILAAGSEIDA